MLTKDTKPDISLFRFYDSSVREGEVSKVILNHKHNDCSYAVICLITSKINNHNQLYLGHYLLNIHKYSIF